MSYCTADDVITLTGARPEMFRLEKNDTTGLENKINEWILQSKDLIDNYCHQKFNENTPPAIKNICIRLTSNMVAMATARRDTPLIKVNDWNVKVTSSAIFTQDLKDDLRDGKFVLDKSHKSDSVEFFAITGD